MFRGSRSIGQVAAYKPLATYNMEELAARQRDIQPSGGVLFARNADGAQKRIARQRALDLFVNWPGQLRMVTMPGLHWRFERLLLAARDPGWIRRPRPSATNYTHFTGCESDRPIFYASVAQMPGLHTSTLKRVTKYGEFAEMAVKTKFASLFFANMDDFMSHDWNGDGWDAVWLDYTAPLTVERLALITYFYERYVNHILIITALRSRVRDEGASRSIADAGGYMPWLRAALHGDVLHEIEYFDTSAMAQFAVRKAARWTSPLV